MKVWIYILVFVILSLVAVNSQTCPSGHFSAVFTATIDQILDNPVITQDDPELTFFKTNLKFRDSDIQRTIDDAIRFFNNTFALDFSSPPNERNQRFFQNARMNPFMQIPGKVEYIVTDNHWIRTGNTYSSCYFIHYGGFQVTFSADQTLYGSYGGTEGKPAEAAINSMIYAFYFFNDVCKQSPLIVRVRNTRPIRTEPVDGANIEMADLYNPVLGYGKLYSIFGGHRFPGGFSAFGRAVFTFSGQ